MKKSWLEQHEAVVVFFLSVAGAFVRFWRLGLPNEVVFDEVYYPKWGNDYLHHIAFFDVHPPLGKLLYAVSIFFLGNTTFGYRFIGVLFGAFTVPLTYYVAKRAFTLVQLRIADYALRIDATRIALLSALFVLLDGLILVQDRIALLDSFVITFSLAAYATFIASLEARSSRAANLWFLLCGVFLGMGVATKWTAVAPLVVLFIWSAAFYRNLKRVNPLIFIASFGIIPAIIYVSSFVFNVRDSGFWHYFTDWQMQAWHFHATLRATHPYQSRWWSWLYLARPVWYYFKQEHGMVRGIIALGNPVLWWAALVALVVSVYRFVRHRELQLLFPLLAFFAAYLPWVVIGRTEFQYYVVPGVPFYFMLLAWWVNRMFDGAAWTRILAYWLIILAVSAAIFFFPIWIGYPISSTYYHYHTWFRSWI